MINNRNETLIRKRKQLRLSLTKFSMLHYACEQLLESLRSRLGPCRSFSRIWTHLCHCHVWVRIPSLCAHLLVVLVFWLVDIKVCVHVPTQFLCWSHWIGEFLLGKHGESIEFLLENLQLRLRSFLFFFRLYFHSSWFFGDYSHYIQMNE